MNYITGIPVLYKILKKIHNTGTNFYTSDRQVQEIPQSITGYKIATPNLWIIHFIHICLVDVAVFKCSLKRGDGFIGCKIFVLFLVMIIFNYFVPDFIFWQDINIFCLNFASHSILILLAYFHDKYIMYVLYLIHTIQNIHDILPIEMSNISCPYRILRYIYIYIVYCDYPYTLLFLEYFLCNLKFCWIPTWM